MYNVFRITLKQIGQECSKIGWSRVTPAALARALAKEIDENIDEEASVGKLQEAIKKVRVLRLKTR